MRFLFCNSFICFCKSSSQIYSPAPLKLEISHRVPSTVAVVSSTSAIDCIEDEDGQKEQPEIDSGEFVKSCLKKKTQLKETKKKMKKVRWMDYYSGGMNALVEIKEFEPSEYEVRNNQGNGSHDCIIL